MQTTSDWHFPAGHDVALALAGPGALAWLAMATRSHDDTRTNRLATRPVLALGLLLIAPLIAWAALPHLPGCVLQSATGLPCPGCGLGRAVIAMFRLQLGAAVTQYPPLALLLGGYLLALAVAVARLFGRTVPREAWLGAACGGALAAALVSHWVVGLTRALS